MLGCGMSCPNNQYVCLQQQAVWNPMPNQPCFPSNPASRTTPLEWSLHFWEGFLAKCVQGQLKSTCMGKLAMAGTDFSNDWTKLQEAWASKSIVELQKLPPACSNYTGSVGQAINVLHATTKLVKDISGVVSACGGKVTGIVAGLTGLLEKFDQALCGWINRVMQLTQIWLDMNHSWQQCVRIHTNILPPNHDLCYQAGQYFASHVNAYFNGAVC
eukprot:TRINITY_DN66928_c0_g1_i2.p1 TRINITY_DN66928_c0_g1~~TRINITY_DN66928_c0_g1_i2.p1  ORF type:complete len:215 (-),score=6.61 TRINITY_DN66928_c0_g1_i2:133-777(-)